MESSELANKIIDLERKLRDVRIEHWLKDDISSWQMVLLIAVLIIPWIIWWRYVDKKRLLELSLYGALVLIISSYLDAVLTDLVLWSYHYHLLPVWNRLVSADFSLLPVTFMLVYQYLRDWKSFIIVVTAISGGFAFVGEPFLHWTGIYEVYGWKHIYSFPIYIAIPAFLKWFVEKLFNKQESYR